MSKKGNILACFTNNNNFDNNKLLLEESVSKCEYESNSNKIR